MAVAREKGRLRGKQPKLKPRQEAHLVELYRAVFGVSRSTVERAGGHTIPAALL